MNASFDSLSRYPYQNENDRRIIKECLNEEEIEYIIEYSIAPSAFIKYINANEFSIYHIDEYQTIEDNFWYLEPNQVVAFTEQLLNYDNGIEYAINLSRDYYFHEVYSWLKDGDLYNPEAEIIPNPESDIAYLDDNLTMFKRVPFDLRIIDCDKGEKELYLKANANEAYAKMYEAMTSEFETDDVIRIEKAYIDYNEQVHIYNEGINNYGSDCLQYVDYPGHSEHQLGMAIDFDFTSYNNIEDSPVYNWLLEHSYEYGFVQTYPEGSFESTHKQARLNHFRYVGKTMAKRMHDEGILLKEAVQ